MTTHRIQSHLNDLIAAGGDLQIGLRGSPQPLGPAKVEIVLEDAIDPQMPPVATGLYRMLLPATMQANKHSRPSSMLLPVVFAIEDVLLAIEPPLAQDGSPAIVTPSNGDRTPGGLHIPGR